MDTIARGRCELARTSSRASDQEAAQTREGQAAGYLISA
jgi:hypothetical protein